MDIKPIQDRTILILLSSLIQLLDYSATSDYGKSWKYIEIPNLEDNTQYTLSVFTLPISNSSTYYSSDEHSDGFYLMFHDDSDGKSWTTNYSTNWTNAQKSTRFYLESYKVKRFSHTFTTGTNVGTTRVGLNFPHMIIMEYFLWYAA